MLKELYTAAMGMAPQQTRLEVISNNMANAGTVGFKRSEVFERNMIDARANIFNVPGDSEQDDPPHGSFTDFSKGSFQKTGNKLDLAIENDNAFFMLEDDSGNRYLTRSGHFTLSEDGHIITTDGKMLLGENGPINIRHEMLSDSSSYNDSLNASLKISLNGDIFANDLRIGGIDLVRVQNVNQLTNTSNALFIPLEGAYPEYVAYEDTMIRQGWLENSNVDIIKEMVNMIKLQRQFEMGGKAINSNDETIAQSINLGRYF